MKHLTRDSSIVNQFYQYMLSTSTHHVMANILEIVLNTWAIISTPWLYLYIDLSFLEVQLSLSYACFMMKWRKRGILHWDRRFSLQSYDCFDGQLVLNIVKSAIFLFTFYNVMCHYIHIYILFCGWFKDRVHFV
jgi:hypothetical protein